jgi:aspartyl-tRNA(Asn)/glutamyl-tRNA(Gln) amidotransferase subunit A
VDLADLGVLAAARALRRKEVSSAELTEACLSRIRERDGAVNAWVRVYEEDARTAAARADKRLARGAAPLLCGIPVGLKDLYAVAGKPLTASSRVLDVVPRRSCTAWTRLRARGMVLLGHLHTHEFAAGGTTDQVANPWAHDRTVGGSSGGSAAALAAGMTPAATGTDTAGSLRIPSALCGTSTIKPTRGTVPTRGIVPLGPTFDHAGPMARSLEDCAPLLAALADGNQLQRRAPVRRIAVSPRLGLVDLDADVADGFETALAACRSLGLEVVDVPAPDVSLELGLTFLDLVCAEMLVYHRRFDDRRGLYRPSIRGFIDYGEHRALSAESYVAAQGQRAEATWRWVDWFAEHRVDALIEPTVPIVAQPRGHGYDEAFTDVAEISLTHYWNWTSLPVVALPSGVGGRSGLPVGVSLIGAPGSDWDLLATGVSLQASLGIAGL